MRVMVRKKKVSAATHERLVARIAAGLSRTMMPIKQHEKIVGEMVPRFIYEEQLQTNKVLVDQLAAFRRTRLKHHEITKEIDGIIAMASSSRIVDCRNALEKFVDELLNSNAELVQAAHDVVEQWSKPGGGVIPESMVKLGNLAQEYERHPLTVSDPIERLQREVTELRRMVDAAPWSKSSKGRG